MSDTVYTESVVSDMVNRYKAVVDKSYDERSVVVKELAGELGRSVASVRAKLVREGVYVAKEDEKNGSASKTKGDYVKAFSAVVGTDLNSLNKASKKDLAALWNWIVVTSDQREAG